MCYTSLLACNLTSHNTRLYRKGCKVSTMPGGLSPPPEVYLSWPKPNYVDPPSRGNAVVVLNFVLLALCFIVVGLRSYARLLQANTFGLDDVFVLVGMIPLTGFGVCILLGESAMDAHSYSASALIKVRIHKVWLQSSYMGHPPIIIAIGQKGQSRASHLLIGCSKFFF